MEPCDSMTASAPTPATETVVETPGDGAPPAGTSQTLRFERKREAILQVAAGLFNARGLGGAKIADVAQAVGLTTTSVTYYYRKKEDLAAACLMRSIAHLGALLEQAEPAATPALRLGCLLDLYFSHLAGVAEGRAPVLINFWDLRGLTGPLAPQAMEGFVAVFRRVRSLLFQHEHGPKLTRPEQNARAHLVLSAVLWAKEWIARYEVEDYARASARIAEVLVHGLAGTRQVWAPIPLELTTRPAGGGEVSREAFLRAATILVNEQGYRGASVDRISARLNVTKGSFYHHNETKDDLVADCFERTFEVIRQAHRCAQTVEGNGWDRITALSAALVRRQLSGQGALLRYSAFSAAPPAARPGLMATFGRLSERTAGMIADGIVDGSIRPVDPVVAAQLVTGMVNATAELSKWSPAVTEANAADLFAKPLFLGLFSPGERAR